MTPEKFQRVRDLFHACCAIAANERAAWLERECGSDVELREEISALLESDARRLAANADRGGLAARLADEHFTESADSYVAVGPYSVIRRIGMGGMGLVYEARQEAPRRSVALKIIRPGMFSPQLARRFEFEVDALAQLNHPGIAQIFDAGIGTAKLQNGVEIKQPFLAMEFVAGRRLDEYVKNHPVDERAALTLLVSLCDAVQHAHQKGVIHRDLKPANILVGEHGQTKIIDFGVARATGQLVGQESMLTESGQFVGTPAYMSPEQLSGNQRDIDTRSDVYALGVIAFELLTGAPPYELTNSSLLDAVRIIADTPPRRPRRVNPKLSKDLELILMKALEKDREQRYSSAAGLRADLIHYLAGEAISARPPSLLYQVRVLSRRHRVAFLAGAAMLAVLTISLIVSTSFYLSARDARNQEEGQRKIAQREARIAQAVNEFLNQDLLASVSPDNTPNPDIRMREVLDRAAVKIENRFPDEPLVEAAVRETLGQTLIQLGDHAAALPQLEKCVALRKAALQPGDPTLLQSMLSLAEVHYGLGELIPAESIMTSVFAEARKSLGPEHMLTRSAMNGTALFRMMSGRKDGVEELFQESLAAQRKVDPDDAEVVAMSMNLAIYYLREGRPDDAEPLLLDARRIAAAKLSAAHPYALLAASNLAALYNDRREYDKSIPLLRETLATQQTALGPEHPQSLITANNLGFALMVTRDYESAAPILENCTEVRIRKLSEDHPHTLVSMLSLGKLRMHQQRYEEAEALLRCCYELQVARTGANDVTVGSALFALGDLFDAQFRFEEAEPWHRAYRENMAARVPIDDPRFLIAVQRHEDCIAECADNSSAK
ncbi:MAG: tetratricopeptide repeat protein [Phycisphaerae bacterium]